MQNLTDFQKYVILKKGTEPPFDNKYHKLFQNGIYVCAQCYNPLFYSSSKFESGCGWPAFDANMKNSLTETPDTYNRTCVDCQRCKGHVGHVFSGERFTKANVRYCANSASMQFIPDNEYLYGYFDHEINVHDSFIIHSTPTSQDLTFIRLRSEVKLEDAITHFKPKEMVCLNQFQLDLAKRHGIEAILIR